MPPPSRSKDECPYFFRARQSLSPELRVLAATAAYYNWTEAAVRVRCFDGYLPRERSDDDERRVQQHKSQPTAQVAVLSPQSFEATVSALALQAQLAQLGIVGYVSSYDAAVADGAAADVGPLVSMLEPIAASNVRVIYMLGTAQHGAAIMAAATVLSMTKEHVWIGTSEAGELIDSTATATGGAEVNHWVWCT